MVELFEQNVKTEVRQSSKGNQLKWKNGHIWYKADYAGYEGLAEYVVSGLLFYSSLKNEEYISYQTEEIFYKSTRYLGCKSRNFLPTGWRLITLERLFQNVYGHSLSKSIYMIDDYANRIHILVEQTIRLTGLEAFGSYLSKLLTIDALFLNEDRHTHNIAVLQDSERNYHYCPIFDNGVSFLADTFMDYPLDSKIDEMIPEVKAKTICQDFDEQLDVAEQLYGRNIRLHFSRKEVEKLLEKEQYYSEEKKQRVLEIVMNQRRKYQYLFC